MRLVFIPTITVAFCGGALTSPMEARLPHFQTDTNIGAIWLRGNSGDGGSIGFGGDGVASYVALDVLLVAMNPRSDVEYLGRFRALPYTARFCACARVPDASAFNLRYIASRPC